MIGRLRVPRSGEIGRGADPNGFVSTRPFPGVIPVILIMFETDQLFLVDPTLRSVPVADNAHKPFGAFIITDSIGSEASLRGRRN